jgi:aspartyl-tRNA(Asn)/glutamyl-tRNA(Gln) amidotransferase subunit A
MKIRIGRPAQFFWSRLDPEVRKLAEAALKSLTKLGAVIADVSLPTIEGAAEAANVVALVEAREVHESAGYFPARASEYGADVRQRLELGGSVRGVEYVAARKVIEQSRAEWESVLSQVDLLVVPSTPIPAPRIGVEQTRVGNAEESVRNALLRLNRPANFTGMPALSLPCGFASGCLPVGLQLIGPALGESAILRMARCYEQEHSWTSAHPDL